MISSSTVVNSVVEKLRQALARGQWRTGDMLPGQRELAEQLGISRPSLREAVTVLETAARLRGAPDAALVEASQRLVEGNDTCMFATVLCGVVDVATGELVMASAGHEPPVRLHADGRRELLPVESGPPLGFEPIAAFDCWRGRLEPGDALLAYTDGITEAFDAGNRAFGVERLLAALDPGDDAQALCARLVAAVHRFADGAPQSDDITVLALRRTGG